MFETIELKNTIGDLLDSQTERYGDREALVHVEAGTRLTYREFKAECDRVARGLMAVGIDKGQHVAIWVTNYLEWVVAQFATYLRHRPHRPTWQCTNIPPAPPATQRGRC